MGSATEKKLREPKSSSENISVLGKWKFNQYKKQTNVRPPQKVRVGCSRSIVDSHQSNAEDVKRVNQL